MSRLSERIENFKKSFSLYEKAVIAHVENKSDELYQMSVIQSFEVCFELSWKVLKDYLLKNGIAKQLPREVIKEAFATNIIENGEIWIEMMQDRNATSHEYNSDKINKILEKISTIYFQELQLFHKGVDSWDE